MTITTKQNRGWIVALGATPLLALMLSVGIGHADSRTRGGNPGGGHERGSAGSWSGGRGGSSWRGGDNGGRDYSRGGHSGGGYSGGGDWRGGYSGGYSRGGYSGGYTRGGYSGGYSRGGYSGGYSRGGYSGGYSRGGIRYRPGYGYSGGYRRYGPRGYYYPRSRSYVHFGIGLGYPYPYYAPTRVVVARPVRTILIANYPPSGCYYYDPYCDMRFDCLDDYYEHMQDCGHDATLEVIDGSGDCVGTYGYVNGEWTIEN